MNTGYETAMNASADALARIIVDRIEKATAGMPPGRLTTKEILIEGARRASEELAAEWAEKDAEALARDQQAVKAPSRQKPRARTRSKGGGS